MEYVRPFEIGRSLDVATAFESGASKYQAQIVSRLESALIIGSWIESGGCGPDLHFHASDQAYYLVRGEINVQLGDDVHAITAGTYVHIPAGVAHRNWNDGAQEEFHIELLLPHPEPGQPLMTRVDRPEDAPGSREEAFVRTTRADDYAVVDGLPGMSLCQLSQNDNAVVNAIRVAPGGEGPRTHIHEFDQYYFVLDGTLEVEVALQRHSVGPGNVVLLPAGVPHRQWNAGSQEEVHLAVLAPAPEPGKPWDYGVSFAANGINHVG